VTKDLAKRISEMENALKLLTENIEVAVKADNLPDAARGFIVLKEFHDRLGDLLSHVSDAKNKWAYEEMPALFERQGVTSYNLKEGYRVGVQALVRASTRDMDTGIKWARENGQEWLVKETINASTLAGFARSRAEAGEPDLPADVFNVHFGMNTSVTRTRPS
jgi:hypothetical protein